MYFLEMRQKPLSPYLKFSQKNPKSFTPPLPSSHQKEEKAVEEGRKDERSSSRSFICSSKGSAEGASENPLPQSPQGHSQLGCSQASLLPRCIIHSFHLSIYLSIIIHAQFDCNLCCDFHFHLCFFLFSYQSLPDSI